MPISFVAKRQLLPRAGRTGPRWVLLVNRTTARFGLAGAAIIVIALVGSACLPRGANDGRATGATPTAEPSRTKTTPLAGQPRLDPDRYAVNSGLPIGITVAVPDGGWSAGGDWVVRGPKGNEAPDGMAIRFSSVANLYKDPLAPSDGVLEPPVGPTVDDLVDAIAGHPAWEAGEPADVTLDGYEGKLVRLAIPSDAEVTDSSPFYLSVDANGGQLWGWEPGQIFDTYILDVGGQRLVIQALHYPATSESDLAALGAVVNSIQLETAEEGDH